MPPALQILEELEGGGAAAAKPGGRAGRLAFTGSGTDQRQQWERVARLEAAALAGDSDMGSDEVRSRRVVVKGCVRQIVWLCVPGSAVLSARRTADSLWGAGVACMLTKCCCSCLPSG